MPAMTPLELMETFPEALPMIRRNLKIWKKYKKEVGPVYNELLDELMRLVYLNDNETDRGVDFMTRHFYERPMAEINKHVARLTFLEKLYGMKGKKVPEGTITEEDIMAAKAAPIGNYVELDRSGFARCPFHTDTHPSAKYYAGQNRIHCFVCGKSFDVIDIVQKLKGVEFLDTVKIILGK